MLFVILRSPHERYINALQNCLRYNITIIFTNHYAYFKLSGNFAVMLDKFFEGSQYYDYPSFEVAIYSLLLALVLSTVIAYTYWYTYEGGHFSKSFFQAMVLSPLVTSMIMMAVGNNLAVGFGIIGAVAIIRFRTNIQNPRNIIFMFVALSVGIATGVYGYAVALAGTLIFCLTALLLYFSPFGGKVSYEYEIVCEVLSAEALDHLRKYLGSVSESLNETEMRERQAQSNRYTFMITLKKASTIDSIFREMRTLEGVSNVRISKKRILEQL